MPSPIARRATCWPIRPRPSTPRVFSASSTPAQRERSQRPCLSAAWACGTFRARAADGAQATRALEQRTVQLRGRADDDRVVVADLLGEVAVRVDVDVEARPQELEAGLGDRLADEDPRTTHTGVCS